MAWLFGGTKRTSNGEFKYPVARTNGQSNLEQKTTKLVADFERVQNFDSNTLISIYSDTELIKLINLASQVQPLDERMREIPVFLRALTRHIETAKVLAGCGMKLTYSDADQEACANFIRAYFLFCVTTCPIKFDQPTDVQIVNGDGHEE